MPRKKQLKINIDKKKICLIQPLELFDYLAEYNSGDYVPYLNFSLLIVEDDKGTDGDEIPLQIVAKCIVEDGDEAKLLGTFTLNNSTKKKVVTTKTKQKENLCYFLFDNKALYTPFLSKNDSNIEAYFFDWIMSQLGLELNNYTEL